MLQDAQRQETGRQMSAQEVEDQIATLAAWPVIRPRRERCAGCGTCSTSARPVRQRLDAELADGSRRSTADSRGPAAPGLHPHGDRRGHAPLSDHSDRRLRSGWLRTRSAACRSPPVTRVTVSPWLVHRHRSLWPDAELFMPERFAPERRGELPALRLYSLRRRAADLHRRRLRGDRDDRHRRDAGPALRAARRPGPSDRGDVARRPVSRATACPCCSMRRR